MAQVNPKDMKPQVYKDPRPAEMFTQYHRSARQGVGWIYDFVRMILTLPTIVFYRARAIGVCPITTRRPSVLSAGTSGGGGGGGEASRFSSTHLPRRTGDVRVA